MASTDQAALLEVKILRRVGARLRELRRASGLTAVQLAEKTGISQGQISKIENGRATLSVNVLTRLCSVFERPVGYLLQSGDEMPRLLGTLNTVKGPENTAIQWFADQVRDMSGSSMSLVALRPSQIGPAEEQVIQLQKGEIDFFIEELLYMSRFVKGYEIFALPYAFPCEAVRQRFLQGEFFRLGLREPLRQAGIRLINQRWNWLRGVQWVLLSRRQPVVQPEDLRGLRVRVNDHPMLKRFWEALGAIPVPLAWSDVRLALKAGDIDVLPTHKAHLFPLGFCRYATYVTLLGDLPPVLGTAVNEGKYQVLPPVFQQGLELACEKAGKFFSRHVEEAEARNEQLNIRRFKAAYLKVSLTPWHLAAQRIRLDLAREGLLDARTLDAVRIAGESETHGEKEPVDHRHSGRIRS